MMADFPNKVLLHMTCEAGVDFWKLGPQNMYVKVFCTISKS